MFVFGDDGRSSRRSRLSGIAVVLTLTVGLVAAVQWHPHPRRPPAAAAPPYTGTCQYMGSLESVINSRGVPDRDVLPEQDLRSEAERCGPQVAGDPARIRPTGASAASKRAQTMNAGVQRAICPESWSCGATLPVSEADVTVVRAALAELGFPDAEVRLPKRGDGVPFDVVIYGVPLGRSVCLVSYARMGRGVVPLEPVGALPGGTCLH